MFHDESIFLRYATLMSFVGKLKPVLHFFLPSANDNSFAN